MIIFTPYFLSLLCHAPQMGLVTNPNHEFDNCESEPTYNATPGVSHVIALVAASSTPGLAHAGALAAASSACAPQNMYVVSAAIGNTMPKAKAALQYQTTQTHLPRMMMAFLRNLDIGLDKYKTFWRESKGDTLSFFQKLGLSPEIIDNLLLKEEYFRQDPLDCESDGEDLTLEKLGVYLYTCESERGGPYKFLNRVLSRADVTRSWEQAAATMAYIWDSIRILHSKHDPSLMIPESEEGTCLYRGMNLPREALCKVKMFQPGFFFRFPAFVSTSTSLIEAMEFCKDATTKKISPTSVLFEISIQNEFRGMCVFLPPFHPLNLSYNVPSLQAIRIESLSAIGTEHEVLFLPYHKFKVTKISDDFPGYRKIHISLVNGPSA